MPHGNQTRRDFLLLTRDLPRALTSLKSVLAYQSDGFSVLHMQFK